MTIELATTATTELTDAMARLIPQLSRSSAAPSQDAIAAMLAQDSMSLFVFRGEDADGQQGQILGMLSLITFTIPTGVRAWIEDVVVDEAARGQGAGKALVDAAVAHANKLGAKSVDLTSRPTREAANRLYRRAGFEARETNVYRYGG